MFQKLDLTGEQNNEDRLHCFLEGIHNLILSHGGSFTIMYVSWDTRICYDAIGTLFWSSEKPQLSGTTYSNTVTPINFSTCSEDYLEYDICILPFTLFLASSSFSHFISFFSPCPWPFCLGLACKDGIFFFNHSERQLKATSNSTMLLQICQPGFGVANRTLNHACFPPIGR